MKNNDTRRGLKMLMMDSLPHDIMNESAFDIASSLIQGDISLNAGHSVMSGISSPNYRSHAMDFGDARLDDDDFFHQVHVPVNGDLSLPCHSLPTRLRRRKATAPQRLVYCDLDYATQEDTSLLELSDNGPLESFLSSSEPTVQNLTNGTSDLSLLSSDPVLSSENSLEVNPDDFSSITIELTDKKWKCDNCEESFNTKSQLKTHSRTHQKKKHLKCDICSKTFGWEYSLRMHMQAHREDNPNKCLECGIKVFNKTALANHMKRVHANPDRPFSCEVCAKKFISKSELNQHSFIHSENKPFVCEKCGKSFRSKNYLERHLKTHTGVKPFTCEHCGKTYADKTGFTAHVRAHLGELPFVCGICGKRYTIKRRLTSHMATHSDARPFKCEECGKTFRSRTNFRMHKDAHQGLKRWSCKFCGRTFLSQGNMAKHERRHVGDKKHKCELCEKAFIEKQELTNHMKMHNGGKTKKPSKKRKTPEQNTEVGSTDLEPVQVDREITEESNSLISSIMVSAMGSPSDIDGTHIHDIHLEGPLNSPQITTTTDSQLSPLSIEHSNNLLSFCDSSLLQANMPLSGANNPVKVTLPSCSSFGLSFSIADSSLFNSCTLCSNCFPNSEQLREHLVEYHRVEPDKVLANIY